MRFGEKLQLLFDVLDEFHSCLIRQVLSSINDDGKEYMRVEGKKTPLMASYKAGNSAVVLGLKKMAFAVLFVELFCTTYIGMP